MTLGEFVIVGILVALLIAMAVGGATAYLWNYLAEDLDPDDEEET